jgi:hypothetical protein
MGLKDVYGFRSDDTGIDCKLNKLTGLDGGAVRDSKVTSERGRFSEGEPSMVSHERTVQQEVASGLIETA